MSTEPTPIQKAERRYLSVATIASNTDFSESRVRKAIANGDLPAVRLGGALRVTPEAYEAWLDRLLDEGARRAVRA